MTEKSIAKGPDQHVVEQVRKARESKRWKQKDLADRLTDLGFKGWRQTKVAKFENGEIKRLALGDVLALAAALEVKPVHLLAGEDEVEISPKLTRTGSAFRDWVRGTQPLNPDNSDEARSYFMGPLLPADEAREIAVALQKAAMRQAVVGSLGGSLADQGPDEGRQDTDVPEQEHSGAKQRTRRRQADRQQQTERKEKSRG